MPDKNTYCTSCGTLSAGGNRARQREEDSPAADSDEKGCPDPGRKIPLITNPYLVLQSIAIPLGIGIFLGAVFWTITGAQDIFILFVVLGGFLALVFLLVMFVLQVVTGGGLLTMFFISSEGVAHRAGSMTVGLDGAATTLSVLAGSPGGTGAGLLAKSQEHNILAWDEIRCIPVLLSGPFPCFSFTMADQSCCPLLHAKRISPAYLPWYGSTLPRQLPEAWSGNQPLSR